MYWNFGILTCGSDEKIPVKCVQGQSPRTANSHHSLENDKGNYFAKKLDLFNTRISCEESAIFFLHIFLIYIRQTHSNLVIKSLSFGKIPT